MSPTSPEYRAHQQKRWMRHDAWRFIRPGWRRFVKQGSEAAALFETYERKYSPTQPRDDHGRWTDEGGGAGNSSASSGTTTPPGATGEPTAGSGRSDPRVLSDTTPDNIYKPGAQLAANRLTSGSPDVSSPAANRDEQPARIPKRVAEDCELLARLDRFTCRSVGTRSCWAQASFRYSQCLIGGYIPPFYH